MGGAARRPVRCGLSLPNRAVLFGVPADVLVETAALAEAAGCFDSVWVGDNFLAKPRLAALVTLAALAARTRRPRLGTICLAGFPLEDPGLPAAPGGPGNRCHAARLAGATGATRTARLSSAASRPRGVARRRTAVPRARDSSRRSRW